MRQLSHVAHAAPDSGIVVEPGRAQAVAFSLRNDGRVPVQHEGRVVVPASWRLLSGNGVIRLAPGERRAHLAQVAVPSAASAGRYVVVLEQRDAAGRLARVDSLALQVRERRQLEVQLVEAPPFARAGTAYVTQFLVRNAGNVPADVRLATRDHHGFQARKAWTESRLVPGESRAVTVEVSTPGTLTKMLRHRVELQATTSGTPGVASHASSVVSVVPLEAEVPGHRLALRAQVSSTNTLGAFGTVPRPGASPAGRVVGEISGGGALRPGGQTRVDLLLRNGGAMASTFGERDEYRIAFTHPRLQVTLGDQGVALSQLTAPSQSGFGVQAMARWGAISAGGFALRPRAGVTNVSANAAMVQYAARDVALVRGHVYESAGADSFRVASVRAQLTPSRFARLDAEVARALAGGGGGAYTADFSGSGRRFSYGASHFRTDSGFRSGAAGARSSTARANLRIAGQLGVRGTLESSHRDASAAGWAGGRAVQSRQAAGDVYLGGHASIGYQVLDRRDSSVTGIRQVTESRFRASVGRSSGALSLRASYERGSLAIAGDSARAPFLHGLLAGSLHHGRGSIFAYANYEEGQRWYSLLPEKRVQGGFGTDLKVTRRLGVRLGLSGVQYLEPSPRTTASSTLGVSFEPAPGHALALQGRFSRLARGAYGDGGWRISYSLPLGIPLGRGHASGGRLSGRVIDAESGLGVPDAIVLLGDRVALTDREGRVQMQGIAAGTQYLQLDLGARGVAQVTATPLPLQVTSHDGGISHVEVSVIRSVSIAGRVRRMAPLSMTTWTGSRDELEEAEALPGLLVTLTREGEVHRRLTDSDGRYSASGLRPGTWRISVQPGELPPHHAVDVSEVTLSLSPSQSGSASFDVAPRRRSITMIDRAEIVADAGVEARTPATPARRQPPLARAASVVDSAAVVARAADPRAAQPAAKPRATTPRAATPPVATPPGATPRAAVNSFYVVRESDRSLANVALWVYGDVTLWPRLWLANRATLTSPEALRKGQVLAIPPKGPLTAEERRAGAQFRSSMEPR